MVQHNHDGVWRLSCNTYVRTFSMWYVTRDIFENTTTSSSLFLAFQNTQTFYPAINSRRERSSFASFIFHGNPWKTSWTPVQNNETVGELEVSSSGNEFWHNRYFFLFIVWSSNLVCNSFSTVANCANLCPAIHVHHLPMRAWLPDHAEWHFWTKHSVYMSGAFEPKTENFATVFLTVVIYCTVAFQRSKER